MRDRLKKDRMTAGIPKMPFRGIGASARGAQRREAADAYRDQELAHLFTECAWTQEKISRKMGKTQAWVAYRLIFGRFLNFITTGYKDTKTDQLTERSFRTLYARTRGSEAERFALVVAKMTDALPIGIRNQFNKPGYRPAMMEMMSDGKLPPAARPSLQGSCLARFFFLFRLFKVISAMGTITSENCKLSDDGTCQQETAHAPTDVAHPRLRRAGPRVPTVGSSFSADRPRTIPGSTPFPPARGDSGLTTWRQPNGSH
jgi:hypothetical protein